MRRLLKFSMEWICLQFFSKVAQSGHTVHKLIQIVSAIAELATLWQWRFHSAFFTIHFGCIGSFAFHNASIRNKKLCGKRLFDVVLKRSCKQSSTYKFQKIFVITKIAWPIAAYKIDLKDTALDFNWSVYWPSTPTHEKYFWSKNQE